MSGQYIVTVRIICMSCTGREPHWGRRHIAFNSEEAAHAYVHGFLDCRDTTDPDVVDIDSFVVITAAESRRRARLVGN